MVEGRARLKLKRGGTNSHQPAKVAPVVQLMGCFKSAAVTVPEREKESRKKRIGGKRVRKSAPSGLSTNQICPLLSWR